MHHIQLDKRQALPPQPGKAKEQSEQDPSHAAAVGGKSARDFFGMHVLALPLFRDRANVIAEALIVVHGLKALHGRIRRLLGLRCSFGLRGLFLGSYPKLSLWSFRHGRCRALKGKNKAGDLLHLEGIEIVLPS